MANAVIGQFFDLDVDEEEDEQVRGLDRAQRVFRERVNPLETLREPEIFARYRYSRY